jgi:hypothetical protein
MTTQPGSTWPRQRLLIRSIISATLPVGWTWAAITALLPYFLIDHGSGTSAETVLGATRATWMSLHVWSTIAMALVTITHVLLNRRGVSRSVRILSGARNKASSTVPSTGRYAWLGAALLIVLTTVGGFAFAAVDNTHPDGRRGDQESATIQADDGLGGGNAVAERGRGRR